MSSPTEKIKEDSDLRRENQLLKQEIVKLK